MRRRVAGTKVSKRRWGSDWVLISRTRSRTIERRACQGEEERSKMAFDGAATAGSIPGRRE
jgi:hypothetical protein